MSLVHEILRHEVYPALGCTEPSACAYAAALAAHYLGQEVEQLELRVDGGTFKNGAAVVVPHTGGKHGNLIAAAVGAMLANPDARLELLRDATTDHLREAEELCRSGRCTITCLDGQADLRVEAVARGGQHVVRAVLAGGHTNIERVERDGEEIALGDRPGAKRDALAYRDLLRNADLRTLLMLPDSLDAEDLEYLRTGLRMNEAMSQHGLALGRTAHQLNRMKEQGFLTDDMFFRVKLAVSSAIDARMGGVDQPVMTSGGSGNQGIVATLTASMVGRAMDVDEERILRSIAVAHLLNAYVKCFVGELSPCCGCAMAAGIATAAAIVYQQAGIDMVKIDLAVNSVIGDLGGLICDGAKPGCALKGVSAVDTAIRSGLMALEDYGLSGDHGLVGRTAEDSIRNLGRMTLEGMLHVDPTLLKILQEKPNGSAPS